MSKHTFLIDKGVMIPQRINGRRPRPVNVRQRSGPGRPRIYPFFDMKHGESFYLDESEGAAKARKSGEQFNKRHPDLKVVTRKEGYGVRFWVVFK